MRVKRDLYVHTNVAAPYRVHLFKMLDESFRHTQFIFYTDRPAHTTWKPAREVLGGMDVVVPQKTFRFLGRIFSTHMLRIFVRQRKGSVHLVGAGIHSGDWLLVWLLGILHLAKVIKWNDAGFVDAIRPRDAMLWNRLWRLGCCGVFTPGEMGRRYSGRFGFHDAQMINAYFSHDVDAFARFHNENGATARILTRKRLGIAEGKTVVLTISRWLCLKRLEDASNALALLEKSHPDLAANIEYVLIGQGDWCAHEPILKSLKTIKVHFVKDMPYDEVLSYYSAADAFLFPSEGDIWGLVVNEALSMGLPVICTDVIGAAELVENGINGFRLPKRRPDELCRSLFEMLNDESKLTIMKQNAIKIIAKWNSRRGVESLCRFVNGGRY